MPYRNKVDKQAQQRRIKEKYSKQLCHNHGGVSGVPSGGHCKKCNAVYMRDFQKRDLRRRLLFGARERAVRSGVEFNITLDDIYIPLFCPLLKIPLRAGTARIQSSSPTLDRFNPKEGYVSGNVWVISHKANRIKSNASFEEIQMVASGLENFSLAFGKRIQQ
jgi:hypothetical protein